MRPQRLLLVALSACALLWGAYRAYRAHVNLVTLTVRNLDVHRVVSKLEWQTWERITVNTNVSGNVTLNVHSVPLEEVLNIIGLQTDSRWTRLYPIHSSRKSLGTFTQVLRGEIPPAAVGWSALQQLAAWQQMDLGGFANTLRSENKLVSVQLSQKDLAFAALALSRFSKAQVVPEDRLGGTVNLKLQQVPFDKAVASLARQAHRRWSKLYTLQPLYAPPVRPKENPEKFEATASGQSETNPIAPPSGAATLPPEQAMEAILATMTPEERQQTVEQMSAANQAASLSSAERQQQMQAGTSLTAQAMRAAQNDLESRIQNRLKNGTVDQRIAHDRRELYKQSTGQKR
jgi:hypothetical protein